MMSTKISRDNEKNELYSGSLGVLSGLLDGTGEWCVHRLYFHVCIRVVRLFFERQCVDNVSTKYD